MHPRRPARDGLRKMKSNPAFVNALETPGLRNQRAISVSYLRSRATSRQQHGTEIGAGAEPYSSGCRNLAVGRIFRSGSSKAATDTIKKTDDRGRVKNIVKLPPEIRSA